METWCTDAPSVVAMRGTRDTGADLVAVGGGGGFTEDAPRPPVPGEEGELVRTESSHLATPHHGNNHHPPLLLPFLKTGELPIAVATPRRPDVDLGYEPEGSASPTPPHLKWAESLRSLLDDQEGIHLFARFLKQEACADLLDFWFACSGFRKLEASASAGGGGAAGGGGGGAGGGVANEEKKLKLAKAIYRKYVLDGDGIVSRRIRPPSKCFIRDCVARQRIDAAMFDQAQAEIQTTMEESAYPLFLKSSVYLEYARTGGGGGESPKNVITTDQSSIPGNTATATATAGVPSGVYLPTLTEGEEWRARGRPDSGEATGAAAPQCVQATARRSLAETPPSSYQCAADGGRFRDSQECRRMAAWPEAASPYYVNNNNGGGGYSLVPVASEEQSMSSDADTVSLTDSSVDGAPPYRYRKQHRREMQESAKANGRIPLPHIPRTSRIPKDIHVEPGRFAADLISRLEAVQRDRDAQERLEERLRRARLEEDADLADLCTPTTSLLLANHRPAATGPVYSQPPQHGHGHAHYAQHGHAHYAQHGPAHYGLLLGDAPRGEGEEEEEEEDPESILDDHVQRVMRTPSCPQSPAAESRSPDGLSARGGSGGGGGGGAGGRHAPKGEAGAHCPYVHKHGHTADLYASKTQRNYADGMSSTSAETAGHSTRGSAVGYKRALRKGEDASLAPPAELERNHKILLWMMEGEKESGRHKRSTGYGSAAGNNNSNSNNGGGGVGGSMDMARPSHPFIQDPTMPPNLAPNPLTQLEEVRRRLEEEESVRGVAAAASQPKQRYVMEVIQRGRAVVRPPLFPPLDVVPAVSDCDLSESEHRGVRKPPAESTTVAYYFCGEPIPYRTSVEGRLVTLGHFKQLLTKRGSYRFYFKKLSDEFDCGVVFEEVREDDAILPIFEEKIIGKVEKID